MRDDHKSGIEKDQNNRSFLSVYVKGYQYDGSGNWTEKHVKWLRSLKPVGLYKEILDEYLLTYKL